jgi:hypothetical protein
MKMRSLLLLALLGLVGCGSTAPGSTAVASPSPSPSPIFAKYKAQEVITAWAKAGLTVTDQKPCAQTSTTIPKTFDEDVCFTIPSIAPAGGQLFSFSTPTNQAAIVAYFGQYLALAPYVYAHANAVAQLNSNLPAAQAAQYDAAMPK